jgi:hypothetical protein
MHILYFVRIERAKDASEAIDKARTALDNNHFADDGFFCSPKADWYVVGGRWSGLFTEITPEGKRAEAEIKAMLDADYPQLTSGIKGVSYGSEELRTASAEAAKRADALYSAATGFPYIRDTYRDDACYADDAKIITPELLAALRASSSNDAETCLVDDDGNPQSEWHIDRLGDRDLLGFWLVVIDYHS